MSAELSEAFVREQTVHRIAEQVRATGQALPGTEGQIAQLIKDEFVLTVGDGGLPTLVSKDGRPVREAVAGKLGSQEFSHFRTPEARAAATHAAGVARLAAQIKGTIARTGGAIGLAGTNRRMGG